MTNQSNSIFLQLIRLSALIAWFVSFLMNVVILSFIFAMVVLFYFVGQSVRIGLLPRLFRKYNSLSQAEFFVLDVLFSLIITTSLISILAYLYLLYVISIMIPIFCLIIFVPLISPNPMNIEQEEEMRIPIIRRDLIISLSIIISVGLVVVLFQLIRSPYPKSPGIDSFFHLAAVDSVIYSHGTYNIVGSSYSYIYHSIIASLTLLSGSDVIWCYNAVIGFTYPYSLIITFFFLVSITKNAFLSVLATVGTLAVFEHGSVLATYYPFPSSYAYIFVFTIFVSSIILRGEKKAIIILLLAYSLVVLSYIALLIASAPIFIYLLEKGDYLPSRLTGISKGFFALAIIGVSILYFMVYFLLPLWGIPNFEYIIYPITIKNTFDTSVHHFTLNYSPYQYITMALGIAIMVVLVFRSNQSVIKRLNDLDSELILLVTVSYLLLFFAPLEYSFRTEEFIRPFYILLMIVAAFSVFSIIECIRPNSKFYEIRYFRTNPKSKAVIILTVIVLIPLNYGQVNTQVGYLLFQQNVMPEDGEMEIFRWIENHTEVGDYILSDIATGFIMRGCIFRNASTSFFLDGRVASSLSNPELSELIFKFMNCSESEIIDAYNDILSYKNITAYTTGIAYIVVSPRTNSWVSWCRANGRLDKIAPYRLDLGIYDPAWTKWFSSRFTIVVESVGAMVLTINL